MENSTNDSSDKLAPKRINYAYVRDQILGLFNLEKGVFFSIGILLINPGRGVREYLHEDRTRMMKPILFLALSSALFLAITFLTGTTYNFLKIEGFTFFDYHYKASGFSTFLNSNLIYLNLVLILFISIWARIFFRRSKYNVFEIVTVLSFLFGEALLFFSIPILVLKLFKLHFNATLLWFPYVIYLVYGLESFFADRGKRILNGLKVLSTYLIGFVTYLVFMLILTVLLGK
ncbi:MAG: DUF3667 domain-containing protein [Bacteroidia bacterium]|nr:DUF3667 domain-containing protein [Bacteroidia bacterium]